MNRIRISAFLLLASLASASGWSQSAAQHRGGAPTAVSGVYSITFNLSIASTLPANSTIVCKAQITPGIAGFGNYNAQAVPVESASGVASVSGPTATCSVEIPFAWTVETARGGAALSYEIDAINAAGSLPAVVRTSAQQGVAESYPSPGGTSSVTVNVTF